DYKLFIQNKQLYHLVRKMSDDIREIKDKLRHQRGQQKKDFSAKVLDDIYTGVVKRLFPFHVYPTQTILKDTLKDYLNNNFHEFMLLQKMKNYCGAVLQNVRSSVWKVYGHERLPSLKSKASTNDIVKWKESLNVYSCYCALFEQNDDSVFWVLVIARCAFTTVAVPILINQHCAFTLAVCDILLNPRSTNVLCTEKRIRRRMDQYLNDFNNGGPCYDSAETIMSEELSVGSQDDDEQSLPDHDHASQSSMLSQEEQDELFDTY
ncbi:3509_t:CDS:2, partial [Ambispora leptoticha]